MKHLIDDFYTQQENIINKMNERHKCFLDKPVDIKIIDPTFHVINIDSVIFKGYSITNGKITVYWKNIKTDGSESKNGGGQKLSKDSSIIIIKAKTK